MNKYYPDRWVKIKITRPGENIEYKLFAGWYGGFTSGESWKLNSGITNIVEQENGVHSVTGCTGSIYYVHKNGEGMSGYMSMIYTSWVEGLAVSHPDVKFEIVPLMEGV